MSDDPKPTVPGFYWIREKASGLVMIAELTDHYGGPVSDGSWTTCGWDGAIEPEDFSVISDRLPEPKVTK